ncbi:ATP-dependent translocase ABCB1-like isoform X3 [Periplaneta americana]|uniref:ATP-dependent translocase ABCB1-like isoform X3 n=1 Tax=Periplaneta americana TaxID=6978 RepID=UPI0037E778DC
MSGVHQLSMGQHDVEPLPQDPLLQVGSGQAPGPECRPKEAAATDREDKRKSGVFGLTLTSAVTQETDAVAATSNLSDWTYGSHQGFSQLMSVYSMYYGALCAGVLLATFMQTFCWEISCEQQVYRLRQIFFAQVLRQDISWYDCNQGGDLTTKLSDDLERVREGLGSKCSLVLQYSTTFIVGLIVGLLTSWKVTLVVFSVGPFYIALSSYLAAMTATSSAREQEKYALASGVADQVLNNMRTVLAFGKQDYEIQRFDAALEVGRRIAMTKYWRMSVCLGIVQILNYVGYGLAFWYGSTLIESNEATPGAVFTVVFSVVAGAFSLGNAMPYMSIISTAVGSASTLFDIIDRVPSIDPYSNAGLKPDKVRGNIEFKDVVFSYPARKDLQVLKRLNLQIRAGQTVALVGASGSGKSTVASLLLRLYDPSAGRVLLDGQDVRGLNLAWLRSQIGVVAQEPALFGVSIFDNISYGCVGGAEFHSVVKASSQANAHAFISTLPQGYDTVVGGSATTQLSGGQKQRVAIARALIRDPPILIFDEATSALDAKTEQAVMETIRQAASGRTSIIIAHRLSTVFEADRIYVLKDGAVLEQGTHAELLALRGRYCALVEAQRTHTDDIEDEPELPAKTSKPDKAAVVRVRMSSCGDLEEELHIEFKESVKDEPDRGGNPMWRLILLNAPEWRSLSLGMLCCTCTGVIMPVIAIFYGEMLRTFQLKGAELLSKAQLWACMFLVLAVAAGIAYFMQTVAMTTAAEHLVKRLRVLAFSNILCQSVSWLDRDENSPHKLSTCLARDAPLVKSAAGLRAGHMLGALVTLLTALAVAFAFGWKLALLVTAVAPFLVWASKVQTEISRRYQRLDTVRMRQAGKVAAESIQNIRTVQALGQEYQFLEIYLDNLKESLQEARKQALWFGLTCALSQGLVYFMYAVSFRFGAYLIENNDMTAIDIYRVFFALAFSAQSIGQTTAYMQDYTRAQIAAQNLFHLVDHEPDTVPDTAKPEIQGHITFSGVHFHYPNRPAAPVLRGFSLEVQPGQTVALVGASGCGKSTVVALLQKFYVPDEGCITVDGHDLCSIEANHLRRHIGVVTQEPILFDCSLRENIAYGSEEPVGMNDIVEAARKADIHEFISSLPQGYDTLAGHHTGLSQLSGGQKQRIAIARALVRNPRILLLDEATSALDATCEQVVQRALDNARQGRTCIVIAHRLSTIQNADSIAMVHRGRVAEFGPHEQLMQKRGRYYDLVKGQEL